MADPEGRAKLIKQQRAISAVKTIKNIKKRLGRVPLSSVVSRPGLLPVTRQASITPAAG